MEELKDFWEGIVYEVEKISRELNKDKQKCDLNTIDFILGQIIVWIEDFSDKVDKAKTNEGGEK